LQKNISMTTKARASFSLANNMARTPSLSKRIRVSEPVEGVEFFSLKTKMPNLVTLAGSFLGGSNFSSNPKLADLTVEMLEEGTTRHSREALRDTLSAIGATIEFLCCGDRVTFRAKFLKEHTSKIVEILAEQILHPGFDAHILRTTKEREIGKLKLDLDSTWYRAQERLSQWLYPKGHPNYESPIREKIAAVRHLSRSDLVRFHKMWGRGSFLISAVGDVSDSDIARMIRRYFSPWKKTALTKPPRFPNANRIATRIRETILMHDKTSVDFLVGGALPIDTRHSDYYALVLGLHVFGGGGFTSRLMQNVREKKGLSYHVRAGLYGMEDFTNGFWYAYGSFAPGLLAQGERAMEAELKKFATRGITKNELAVRKESIAGNYIISLATTGGLAGKILQNAEEERPKEYIDEYPAILKRLTLQEVNGAIDTYVHPGRAVSVVAGAVQK